MSWQCKEARQRFSVTRVLIKSVANINSRRPYDVTRPQWVKAWCCMQPCTGGLVIIGLDVWLVAYSVPSDYLNILFLAATKQLYKWYFPSVCPSVRPSVTPFWLCSHQRIIMKFSGVITNDQSKVHAKCQGQRSKVKVTEVTTQIFVSGL